MRNAMVAALALGLSLLILSNGLTQEAKAEKPHLEPLQVLDDCSRAFEQRDFARYVDHLTDDEQKVQAGYTLLLSLTTLPFVEANPEQIEPEMLLFLRAIGDLIQEHTLHAANHIVYRQDYQYTPNDNDVGKQTNSPHVRDVLMKSAETIEDPRSFLIAALTEISRPVHVAGTEPTHHSELPDLLQFAKVYQQQDWTLYTRGDYAIAVPSKSQSELTSPPADGPPAPASESAPLNLRIEFRKIDGTWKISHVLPTSMLKELTGVMAGATAVICTSPACDVNSPTLYDPSAATPYPSYSPQSPSAAPVLLPR